MKVLEKKNKLHTCNIIYNDCNRGVPNVAWNETPEPFLSCCVPVGEYKNIPLKNHTNNSIHISTNMLQQNMYSFPVGMIGTWPKTCLWPHTHTHTH